MNKLHVFWVFFWLAFVSFPAFSGQEEVPTTLEQKIEGICQQLQPQGLAVAIVEDGQTELIYTYGQKSTESGDQLEAGSLFNIASCSKAFTAASMAVLVEEGKLHWDDRVVDYIPEFKLADPYITRNLNIVDILSHRIGLSTFTGDLLWYHTDYSNEQIIDRMQYLPVEQDFRSEYGYQNNMYMIAGEIVERITGQTWSEFVKEHLFQPLDMDATVASPDELVSRANIAYPHYEGNQMEIYRFKGTKPAASIYSNIQDLSHWVSMWLNEGQWQGKTIVSKSAINKCMAPQTLLNVYPSQKEQGIDFRAYGLGWSMYDYQGVKVVEHGGGMPGYLSKVTMVPEKELGIIVLNNGFDLFIRQSIIQTVLNNYLDVQPVSDLMEQVLKQKEAYRQRKEQSRQERLDQRVENTRSSLEQEHYTGRYRDRFYGEARVDIRDHKLHLTLLPASETFTSEMKHWHYNTYRVDFKDPFLPFGLVTFDMNAKGEVSTFSIELPSEDFHFNNLYFERISETSHH